jgi:hypothetical protein
MSARSIASLPSGIKAPSDDLIGSQEFDLLLHGSKAKPPASEMESAPFVI